jgi:ribosomal protein L31E
MKVRVLFPKDSKKLVKGFREEVYEIPPEVLREMFETYRQTRNASRAVDVICEYVAREAAERWCRAVMGRMTEECISEYLDRQGERIREQCETSVRMWLASVAECMEKCGKDRKCLGECMGA